MTEPSLLTAALEAIADPAGKGGLITAGRASAPRLAEGRASLMLDVTGLSPDAREALRAEVEAQLKALPEVTDVRIALTAERTGRTIIAVGSGKGGVGKSTLSANLAIALHRAGVKTGLIDADIYGPSQPRLLATEGIKPQAEGDKLIPIMSPHGIPMLSLGQMIKPGQAVAWRGPMAGNALNQLLDADWSGVDVLIVDLPPGTGDIQLSMIQKHKPAGAVIVSTPQDLALIDATRAIDLFKQAGVPIIGLVENMAGYLCPHCGGVSDPFGSGGAEKAAAELGLPFIGRIPLHIDIRIASDAGAPPATGEGMIAESFAGIASQLTDWLAKR